MFKITFDVSGSDVKSMSVWKYCYWSQNVDTAHCQIMLINSEVSGIVVKRAVKSSDPDLCVKQSTAVDY